MSNWYSGGFKEHEKVVAERSLRKEGGALNMPQVMRRFRVKQAEERRIIFLDDFTNQIHGTPIVPFCINEHQINKNGDFKDSQHVTCIKGSAPCFLCENSFKRRYVGVLSLLDITPFKDSKTGELRVVPRVCLWAGVADAVLTIRHKKDKRGGNLAGCIFSVTRHGEKSPTVGSDYEFEEKIDDLRSWLEANNWHMQKRFDGSASPIDLGPYGMKTEQALTYYTTLLQPVPYAKLAEMFAQDEFSDGNVYGGGTMVGGQAKGQTANDDMNEVPF